MTKSNILTFKYDTSEQLYSSHLTPVYFNQQVLIRYLYDSRFYCEFVSDTYGNIGNDEFQISFGINKNNSVIMWLGDIKKIPEQEQIYLLVENKEPEGEIKSEFYDAQIDIEFTTPPLIVKVLNNVEKFNSAFEIKYLCSLYKKRSIVERIDEVRRYKRIIMNNIDDFKRFVSELNEIITENTNNEMLRSLLNKNQIAYEKGSKGNKLLEMVYQHILGDTANVIAPFFYLYDLRIWASHTGKEENLKNVVKNLKLHDDAEFKDIFNALLSAINQSSEDLLVLIENNLNCDIAV